MNVNPRVEVKVFNGEHLVREFGMVESNPTRIGTIATLAVFTYNNYAVEAFRWVATLPNTDVVVASGEVDIAEDVRREVEKDAWRNG